MERFFVALILIPSICFSYQQDTNVCPIGTDYYNGACVRSLCPETHYLVNGACLLIPRQTASCGFGFDLINGMCVQQNCPPNFVMINGLCQERLNNNPLPPPRPSPPLYCPNGFSIQYDMCIPNPGIIAPPFCQPRPCGTFHCPFICDERQTSTITSTTTTTTTTPPSTITTTPSTITTTPSTITTTKSSEICPPEYVIIDGECRFVSCLKGTFYKGRCLEAVCSHGLVWTGVRCTQPEVITTIVEIKNNFITETNQTGPEFHATKAINNILYLTETNEKITDESNTSSGTNNCTTTTSTNSNNTSKCCFITTPRMCKKYGSKWVCFNRQYRQCGEICGKYSVKYLRVTNVIEHPSGMLVIPPNPVLKDCIGNDCKISDVVDCSGCLTNQKLTCSPYCYRYRCPSYRCTFIDQFEYCTKYRGSPGCSSTDGCFGSYCYEETSIHQECL